MADSGKSRGRGAALLAALEASKRRPVESGVSAVVSAPPGTFVEHDVGTQAPKPPMGRAAKLFAQRAMLMQAQSRPASDPSIKPQGNEMLGSLQGLSISRESQVLTEAGAQSTAQMSVLEMLTKKGCGQMDQASPPVVLPKESLPVIKMGEMGTRVNLVANYMRVNVKPDKGVFEYEVRFEPQMDSKDFRFKLLNQHQSTLGPAKTFDGVTLYLPFTLPSQVTTLESIHPVTGEVVLVKIIMRQKRQTSDCIHFYNLLIRKVASILGMVQMNRSYYNPHSPIILNSEKLEVWPGYVTAINEFESGVMLCCDVSFRVLRTTTVLTELTEISRKTSDFRKTAQDVLVGLTVLTRYNNKSYRIDEILFNENPQCTFDFKGTPMSYIQYYKEHYNIDIQDKGQPLLLNRLKKKIRGQEDQTVLVCLIPELCFLSGLDDRLRKNFQIMRSLANHTKVAPQERHQALVKYIESVNSNETALALLDQWGLSFEMPLGLEGRVLDPESIQLGRACVPSGPQCDWGRNLNNDILTPVKIENWLLVTTERDHSKAKGFTDSFLEVSSRMGMRVRPPRLVVLQNDRTDTYVNRIRDEIDSELQLVVCVFPTSRDDRYNAVKTLCSAATSVPSQMINSPTIRDGNKLRSVVQKIALQINCKMGGELWAVHIPTKTLMVCGVDVYHDPSRRGNSVVGFVASMNPSITRWYSRAKYQKPGQELVDTLKLCLVECLKKYYELNNDYPKQIVLYRDGVGDGQLQIAIEHEVAQLLSAFQVIIPPYQPKFTMVVVQKKINTRFFWRNTRDTLINPRPGTVVDHTVTRRNWWDFFLVSQHVSQGTVSPTHFIVVHDGGMKPDILQKLSYKMTHMYYNWPGTIRVPAPCQYAHKLAYMVGENIRKDVKEELCNRLFFL